MPLAPPPMPPAPVTFVLEQLRKRGLEVLEEGFLAQTTPAGVTREHAFAYQHFVLDFVLGRIVGVNVVVDQQIEVIIGPVARTWCGAVAAVHAIRLAAAVGGRRSVERTSVAGTWHSRFLAVGTWSTWGSDGGEGMHDGCQDAARPTRRGG